MSDITADSIFTNIRNEDKHEKCKHLIKSIEDKMGGKINAILVNGLYIWTYTTYLHG